MTETIRSRHGRTLTVLGDPSLLTMDRLEQVRDRIDSDPRIASISVVAGPTDSWLRANAPAGPLVAFAADMDDLVGAPAGQEDPAALAEWARRASEKGLWHDWLVVRSTDVAKAEMLLQPAEMDIREADDPSSAHHAVLRHYRRKPGRMSITVDVTWLGPFETGAQVLTTAAIAALAERDEITELRLVGLDELPAYASHLTEHPKVAIAPGDGARRTDVVWYPNQIDGRSNIAAARHLGARVVTTYLDLIAYDIPRYHGSAEAWQSYRALQRRIALSVDGITTISADVAERLALEVPRLEPERVYPLPLGLDHVSRELAPEQPDDDLKEVVKALQGKRFVVILGNDFNHKNRDFAIKAWQAALQAGQPCELVLAGLHVKSSSSKEVEDDLIARHLDLRGKVHTVGHVTSNSRAWLLANAAVVLYPSSAEGFGFVPYEAAVMGTPSVFTDFGPLREISKATGLPGAWSVEQYADDLVAMLSDDARRAQRVGDLEHAIAQHTWAGFAEGLTGFFERIIAMPEVATSAIDAGAAAAETAQLNAILSSRSYRAAEKLRKAIRRK